MSGTTAGSAALREAVPDPVPPGDPVVFGPRAVLRFGSRAALLLAALLGTTIVIAQVASILLAALNHLPH